MKQGNVYKIFRWYFIETAETHQESCGTTKPDTFPSQRYLWYLKVNVVKEEEYSREYRGRCLAGRARSRCQRSRDEVSAALRLQKKLFRLSQSDSSDTRSSSPISRGHSADRALQIDQSDREWGCLFITVSTTDGLKGRQKAPADLRCKLPNSFRGSLRLFKDYTDDDNGEEDETDTFTTSTTTTTTTTPKPSLSQHYEYKDPRAYDSGTGAQYNGYQAKNDYPPMSAHSVHKWQSLGTREGVKETRSNMQQYNKNGKSAEIREALQHAIKVNKEGSCQWPRARVIPVRDVYPSPSTTYIPHCAILHRCSDDTGCCRSETLTCVPKHSHRIELSFYKLPPRPYANEVPLLVLFPCSRGERDGATQTIHLRPLFLSRNESRLEMRYVTSKGSLEHRFTITTSVGGASVVEKLSFYNHTECECKERSEYDTTNEKPADQRVYRHQSSPPPQNMKKSPARKPCRCPSQFTPRITEGVCQCNCFESNENCIKTRRGKGYFSLADRICIQNNECAMPNCEFGEYIKWQGKCPRKRDSFDAMTSYRANLSHRFRS
ncbi:hypothetical protein ALC53_01502 [Atta colombica]|uniref:Platelet-derived growth factor (PDGF) family profile domain-containing protein n=1 Tax=Atta colombica TaxID=520822 RepID=A0A195BTN4_9HYME|nr:hypothetical protein ALC53_01502 [Atta colombica]